MERTPHDVNLNEAQLAEILKKAGQRQEPPAEIYDEVKANVRVAWMEEVEQQKAARAKAEATGWRLPWAVAAGLVLAVGLGFGLSQNPKPTPYGEVARTVNSVEYRLSGDAEWHAVERMPVAGQFELRTAAGSYAAIELESRMRLRINENSSLTLNDAGSVYLASGTLYIEPLDGKADDASIKVTTSFGFAQDIGTRFEVQVQPEGWRVQVREGLVAMIDDYLDIVLNEGERMLVGMDDSTERVSIPRHDESWQWIAQVSSPFKVEGATLEQFLGWWSEETGRKVVYSDAAAATQAQKVTLHGSIEGMTPTDSLNGILTSSRYFLVEERQDQVTLGVLDPS